MAHETKEKKVKSVKFFETEEDKVKAIRLIAGIAQMGKILDEVCFTPIRDIQVFFKKFFAGMSGSSEPITTSLLLAGSLVTSLAYLAKIFNESETTTLQDLLKNCEKEFGTTYFDADKKLNADQTIALKKFFDNNLKNRNAGYLEVEITQKPKRRLKHFFRKEELCDIRYKFKDDLVKILQSSDTILRHINAESIKNIESYIRTQKIKQAAKQASLNIPFSEAEIAKAREEEFTPEAEEILRLYEALDKNSKKFINNLIPTEGDSKERTLFHGRKAATTRVKDFKLSNAPIATYEAANDISFQYWLGFFVFDMMYTQDDSTQWTLTAQFVAIGAAVAIFAIKTAAKVRDWFKRKKKDEQVQEDLKKSPELVYASKSLKGKQLTSYFTTQLKNANEIRLENPEYHIDKDVEFNLEGDILNRIQNSFYSINKTVDEYIGIIEEETKPAEKIKLPRWMGVGIFKIRIKLNLIKPGEEYEIFSEEEVKETTPKTSYSARARRVLEAWNISSGMGIGFSFIEWVLTVSIAAIDIAKTGTQTVANFLNGVGGGVIGILSFVLGTVLGIVYYKTKIKPVLDKERDALRQKYLRPDNAEKIARLKELEQENTAMRKSLKEHGVTLLPTMKIYDDRAYRRKTTVKPKTPRITLFGIKFKFKIFTYTGIKKMINRFSTFIGKAGTGILLFRFLPLAILSLAGISLAAAAASVFWPITAVAIAVGIAWGIMYTYKYIQERRLESAKRFLDRIDETLETAEQHNIELRSQFEPHATEVSNQAEEFGLAPIVTSKKKPGKKHDKESVPLLIAVDGNNYEDVQEKTVAVKLETPKKGHWSHTSPAIFAAPKPPRVTKVVYAQPISKEAVAKAIESANEQTYFARLKAALKSRTGRVSSDKEVQLNTPHHRPTKVK
jgi:hypothetical protein